MPLAKSEYVSDIWKDGIFRTYRFLDPSLIVLSMPNIYLGSLITRYQKTRSCFAPVAQAPSAAPKSEPWSISAPMLALLGAMSTRRRTWQRRLLPRGKVRRSWALDRSMSGVLRVCKRRWRSVLESLGGSILWCKSMVGVGTLFSIY